MGLGIESVFSSMVRSYGVEDGVRVGLCMESVFSSMVRRYGVKAGVRYGCRHSCGVMMGVRYEVYGLVNGEELWGYDGG